MRDALTGIWNPDLPSVVVDGGKWRAMWSITTLRSVSMSAYWLIRIAVREPTLKPGHNRETANLPDLARGRPNTLRRARAPD